MKIRSKRSGGSITLPSGRVLIFSGGYFDTDNPALINEINDFIKQMGYRSGIEVVSVDSERLTINKYTTEPQHQTDAPVYQETGSIDEISKLHITEIRKIAQSKGFIGDVKSAKKDDLLDFINASSGDVFIANESRDTQSP